MWTLMLLAGCGRDAADTALEGVFIEGEPLVACVDPGAREALGPLELLDGGESWQTEQSYSDLSTGMIHAGGIGAGDFDGDGNMDLHLAGDPGGGQLFMGDGEGHWTESSKRRFDGLTQESSSLSTASSVVDVDGDGDLDLFMCHMTGPNALMLNDGEGHFTPAGSPWPAQDRACMGATWGDMDGDGDLDLFISTSGYCDLAAEDITTPEDCGPEWADAQPMALWENRGAEGFVDVSERLDPTWLARGQGHVAAWIDLDGDQDLDLYVINDRMRGVDFLSGNEAWINDGAGGFTRGGAAMGLDLDIEGMGLGVGDLNGDGLPDLSVAATNRIAVMLSAPDLYWIDASAARGVSVPTEGPRDDAWGTELVDLDNDGDHDLIAVFGWNPGQPFEALAQPDALWIQGDDGVFIDSSAEWGFNHAGVGRGLVVTDINGDGWLDVLARDLYAPARILQQRCGEASAVLVELDQRGPNRDALGARVDLEVDGEVQTRWMLTGTGLFGGAPPVLHFGLGEAEAIDRLSVTWPDGEVSEFTDLEARQRWTVSRR